MRTYQLAVTLSLAAALAACSKPDTPTATHSLTPQPASVATDLAGAPQSYQRMRFVSALEQSRGGVEARPTEHPSRRRGGTSSHQSIAARPALASLVSSMPVAMTVASSAAPAATVAIASTQAAPPMVTPAAAVSEIVDDGAHRGRGLAGNVTIRGGVGPNGKCDPRSDAQASGMLAGRPNSAMPLMPSSSVFGRR